MRIPHFTQHSVSGRRVLVDRSIEPQADSITVDSSNADAGGDLGTYHLRAGNVLVLRTSTGRYVEADDANADAPTAASINTLITNPGAGGWDGNLVITGHWGTITVALSGDNTDAAVAAAIIAAVAAQNPESQARITAADATGSVSITNLDKGEGTYLHAVHATVDTMLGAEGQQDQGTDPDVRVLLQDVILQDEVGTAIHGQALAARRGHFDESNLIVGGVACDGTETSLSWAEAKDVLLRRGSRFS